MAKIRNRLAELMAEYHTRTGKRLTQKQLSDATEVAQSTISAYVRNEVSRYDTTTLERLMDFFDCGIGDFFFVIEDDQKSQVLGKVS